MGIGKSVLCVSANGTAVVYNSAEPRVASVVDLASKRWARIESHRPHRLASGVEIVFPSGDNNDTMEATVPPGAAVRVRLTAHESTVTVIPPDAVAAAPAVVSRALQSALDDPVGCDTDARLACGVCAANVRKVSFACGHTLCVACSVRMLRDAQPCPVCRCALAEPRVFFMG